MHHRRAKVFCKMGRFKDAISDLSVALSSQSKDLNLLFSRAICFKVDGQFAAAVTDFDFILSMDRSSTQAFYHRGKQPAMLCNCIRHSDVPLHHHTGICLLELGALEDARESFSDILRHHPLDQRALSYRAYLCAALGELERAQEDLSVALDVDGSDESCLRNRDAVRLRASSLADGSAAGIGAGLPLDALQKPRYEENILDAMEKSSYSYFSLGAQESI